MNCIVKNWEYLLFLVSCLPYFYALHLGSARQALTMLDNMLPPQLQAIKYLELRNTSFTAGNVSACAAGSVLPLVWDSLAHYGNRFTCICNHHLNVSHPCRACMIGTSLQLVNPVIVGQSNEMGRFREQGMFNKTRVIRDRPLAIIVEWTMGDELHFIGRFDKLHAACLAMVIEEFNY
jgi:hypothetical protein